MVACNRLMTLRLLQNAKEILQFVMEFLVFSFLVFQNFKFLIIWFCVRFRQNVKMCLFLAVCVCIVRFI